MKERKRQRRDGRERGQKGLERERERVRKGIGEKGGGEVEIPRRGAILCQTNMGKCRTKIMQIRIPLFLCLPFPYTLLQSRLAFVILPFLHALFHFLALERMSIGDQAPKSVSSNHSSQ